jgi:hypothetical protein
MHSGRPVADLEDLAAVADAAEFGIEVAAWTVGRAGADPPTIADLGAAGVAMP